MSTIVTTSRCWHSSWTRCYVDERFEAYIAMMLLIIKGDNKLWARRWPSPATYIVLYVWNMFGICTFGRAAVAPYLFVEVLTRTSQVSDSTHPLTDGYDGHILLSLIKRSEGGKDQTFSNENPPPPSTL